MNEQERIDRELDALVATGAESGLQVAVYRNGDLIVDAAVGLDRGTPIFSFSTGKNVTATIAHLLVARGFLSFDTPIVDLWPEFRTPTTLRHVLTHTAGLPAMPRDITPAELPDWPRVCASLAAAEPRWQPGTATGYHSYTFGYLLGELARRATGRTMSELLREWITVPLGIEGELYFGVPDSALPGVARLEQPEPAPASNKILAAWETAPSAEFGNDPAILRADIPSVCVATAHGLATMFNALLTGELAPFPSGVAFEGVDQVFGNPARLTLGFPLGFPTPTAIGWPGGGGSLAYADPATGTAFALTKTRLHPNFDTAMSLLTGEN
jgi:CubicO group peptidase (beta-lactamase class C family)